MSLELIPEEDLLAALRPYRVDPQHFEAAVRQRLQTLQTQSASDPFVRLSPFVKAAAAFLPLQVLAGCQAVPTATKAAPAGGFYKLLSYLAFPAISVFVLLGATVFSFLKIRSIQEKNVAGTDDQVAAQESIRLWRRQHSLGIGLVFGVSLALMFIGASSLLFLFYLASLGLLVYVLSAFAKIGVGSRDVIGRTCGMGLMFLGQASASVGIGDQEIHFLDQQLVSAVFFLGLFILLPCWITGLRTVAASSYTPQPLPRWYWIFYAAFVLLQLGFIGWFWSLPRISFNQRLIISAILAFGGQAPLVGIWYSRWLLKRRVTSFPNLAPIAFMIVFLVPVMAWNARSLLWIDAPRQIKSYVESFDRARFSSATWANWEIPASWTIDAQLQPDLSKPRNLLTAELAGEQNPFVLSSAMRIGLIAPEELGELKDYDDKRRQLLNPSRVFSPLMGSIGQYDWVVRAAVLKNDLSSTERDQLEQQLLAILEGLSSDKYPTLEKANRAIQLLTVIGRPVNVDQYQPQIHEILRTFHHSSGGWGRVNGGFRSYKNISAGDLKATAHAVELMEVFGAPNDLNSLWVRSFLSNGRNKFGDEKWIAAATLERFNSLPNSPTTTWLDCLYYERTLIAAMALVGLCVYATYTSPHHQAPSSDNQPCPA